MQIKLVVVVVVVVVIIRGLGICLILVRNVTTFGLSVRCSFFQTPFRFGGTVLLIFYLV